MHPSVYFEEEAASSRDIPIRSEDDGRSPTAAAEDPSRTKSPTGGIGADVVLPEGEEEVGHGDDDVGENPLEEVPKKKKRSKRKPKSKRGLNAPTGFEEYHTDAPLTPKEYEADQKLYSSDLPFPSRILSAIHKYEARRRMTSDSRDIFYKYLAYGGLEIGPNMFQGVDHKDAKEMDKDLLVDALAQTSLPERLREFGTDSCDWVVDFEGLVKGFLSRRAPQIWELESELKVIQITNLITNFFNYLVLHGVCPEYHGQIMAAKKILLQASSELWKAHCAIRWLPGDFNIACSTLFGGTYLGGYDPDTEHDNESMQGFVGQTPDEARQIMKIGIACTAEDKDYQQWYKMAMDNSIAEVDVQESAGLEVVEIIPTDDETVALYKEKTADYRPVGTLRVKSWENPGTLPQDLGPEENANVVPPKVREYKLIIEQVILQNLVVGMKMDVTLRTLNCGISFIDRVLNVYVSFDTVLLNDKFVGFKEGKWIGGYSMDKGGPVTFDPESAKEGDKNGDEDQDEV